TSADKTGRSPEGVVVNGNPPFLGGKRMRTELGDAYVDRMFAAFAGRVPAATDLVAYWFSNGMEALPACAARPRPARGRWCAGWRWGIPERPPRAPPHPPSAARWPPPPPPFRAERAD